MARPGDEPVWSAVQTLVLSFFIFRLRLPNELALALIASHRLFPRVAPRRSLSKGLPSCPYPFHLCTPKKLLKPSPGAILLLTVCEIRNILLTLGIQK
jgi:hypothetical protein